MSAPITEAHLELAKNSRKRHRVKKGKWLYRNFHIVTQGWHWRILSACGDTHPAKSLAAAMKQIDAWYAEGSVES